MSTKLWPLATAVLVAPLTLAQGESPNFLLVISDDVTINDLPLYGGPNISTPHIDGLASEGLTSTWAHLSMAM
ncbi:MAG: sulfatase-like hydrolase/transferase [Bryobacterales bacterium]|nr:sulfatase-like hydrolase/transferase [Bryobacterales bacterium]